MNGTNEHEDNSDRYIPTNETDPNKTMASLRQKLTQSHKENASLREQLAKERAFRKELVEGLDKARNLMQDNIPSVQSGKWVEWLNCRDQLESLLQKSKSLDEKK